MARDIRKIILRIKPITQVYLHGSRMKPTRIRMCHSLVMNYGLYKRMEIFVSYAYLNDEFTCLCFKISAQNLPQSVR
jgi:hypothetical protein